MTAEVITLRTLRVVSPEGGGRRGALPVPPSRHTPLPSRFRIYFFSPLNHTDGTAAKTLRRRYVCNELSLFGHNVKHCFFI